MQALLGIVLVASLFMLTAYLLFLRQQRQFTGNLGPRQTSPTKGTPGDKIVLTGFFTPVGKLAGSVSPFTNKIETYLRFAGLPFKTENGGFAGSPKGRVVPHLHAMRRKCTSCMPRNIPCSNKLPVMQAVATAEQLNLTCSCHGCNMATNWWQTRVSS